jgi:hypothetical protein
MIKLLNLMVDIMKIKCFLNLVLNPQNQLFMMLFQILNQKKNNNKILKKLMNNNNKLILMMKHNILVN